METELFADIMVSRSDALISLAGQIDITTNTRAKNIMLDMMEKVLQSVTLMQKKAEEAKASAVVLPFNKKDND